MRGRVLLAGVAGWPVAHSLSPLLHKAWIDSLGLCAFYVPLPVPLEEAHQALKALPSLGFSGVNLTLPLKETAFDIADEHHVSAQNMGVANLLLVQGKKLIAHNTDGEGFLEALRQRAPAYLKKALEETQGQKPLTALVLGAGGAGRAVVCSLLDLPCFERIFLTNRTIKRAEDLQESTGSQKIDILPWAQRHHKLSEAHLIVNTTPCGMAGYPPLDLDLSSAAGEACVYDLVYTPVETHFLRAARQHSLKTIDGLTMLIEQARPSFRAFYGLEPPKDFDMRAYLLKAGASSFL